MTFYLREVEKKKRILEHTLLASRFPHSPAPPPPLFLQKRSRAWRDKMM